MSREPHLYVNIVSSTQDGARKEVLVFLKRNGLSAKRAMIVLVTSSDHDFVCAQCAVFDEPFVPGKKYI